MERHAAARVRPGPGVCRPLWLLPLLLILAACALDPSTQAPAPTPAGPTAPSSTAAAPTTRAPTATPAPAPLSFGCDAGVPAGACAQLAKALAGSTMLLTPAAEPSLAAVRLEAGKGAGSAPVGAWWYAVAAPFFTIDDDVTLADVQSTWRGQPAGPLVGHPLLASTDTVRVLSALWGQPAADAVRTAGADALLAEAEQSDGWAILPFDELQPGWKVLRVDGISLLEKGLDAEGAARYPLEVPLALSVADSAAEPAVLPLVAQGPAALTNRSESQMTVLAMTGVSCLARVTGRLMGQKGLTYPAEDIKQWLVSADLTHISHEASFTPDCPLPPSADTMSFCSHDSYIELLEEVGTDIVELTGNHLADYGRAALAHTLEMFRERGWQWFGGGANLEEARRPLLITSGPNRLAFLGANPVGPAYDWATETEPGSNPVDYARMEAQIRELRAQGYLPIVTLQYLETYDYAPTPQQVVDFRGLADAGAVVVQGSQAHQPQTMELYGDTFIHYGLGNLFFDQMWSLGTRQEFIDRLVFYDGRLLSVDLRTAMLEEYGRPRPMTPQERRELLQAVFAARP